MAINLNPPDFENLMLETGSGQWNAIVLVFVILFSLLIAWLIYRRGNSTYHKGTEQTKPFICGWPEASKRESHMPGGSLYWGLTEAMQGYYEGAMEEHSGIINDYMSWFVLTAAVIAVVILITGGI